VKFGSELVIRRKMLLEKFHDSDTPESYEERIQPWIKGIEFEDALDALYDHLPEELEIRMRITKPKSLNEFFIALNKEWLEVKGKTSMENKIEKQEPVIENRKVKRKWIKNVGKKIGEFTKRKNYRCNKCKKTGHKGSECNNE
jgi:hypothetical protein